MTLPALNSPEGIRSYVLSQFEELHLHGWQFRWDKARRRLGSCNYCKKVVSLSAYFVSLNWDKPDQILDTIRHELAHALAWERKHARGHGKAWKEYCLMLGAEPKARISEGVVKSAPYKYVLRLRGTKQIVAGYYRKPAIARRVKKLMLKGRPETLGQLELVHLVESTEEP